MGGCRLIFALAMLALPGRAEAQALKYQPDPDWRAPAQEAARVNPLAKKPEAAGGGRKLFLRHCSECHGKDGRGILSAPGLHLPVVQQQSDGALFWKITNGNPGRGMPSFSRFPQLQRWQLVLYLRSMTAEGAGGKRRRMGQTGSWFAL